MIIQEGGLNATNRYKLLKDLPTAEISNRLGPVKLNQMTCTLQYAIENPDVGIHILEVEQIPNAADLKLKNLE